MERSFRDLMRALLSLRAVGPSEGWSCPRDEHGRDIWEVLLRENAPAFNREPSSISVKEGSSMPFTAKPAHTSR